MVERDGGAGGEVVEVNFVGGVVGGSEGAANGDRFNG